MTLRPITIEAFCIEGATSLDPIRVYLEDTGPGTGRLTLACFGQAWENYWQSMGQHSIRDFLRMCDADYIVGKLIRVHNKAGERYLTRIVLALKEALKSEGVPA